MMPIAATVAKLKSGSFSDELGALVVPVLSLEEYADLRAEQVGLVLLLAPHRELLARRALLEQQLVSLGRAFLQPQRCRRERVRSGRTVGAEDEHVDHRRWKLTKLVADDSYESRRIAGRAEC